MKKVELKTDIVAVRDELRTLLPEIRNRKISLKKATVTIYCCSNLIRAVVVENELNKVSLHED